MRHFVNVKTGTIILINEDNEEEIKKYRNNKDYYEYFVLRVGQYD